MARLAHLVVRRRVPILVLAVVLLALAGFVGGGVARNLTTGGFADPGADSTRAALLLEDEFGQGPSNLLLLVTADGGVDDPEVAAAGLALTEELAAE